MMKKVFFVILAVMISSTAWAETIKIGGSGGMISLVTELAQAYMAKNPGDVLNVMQDSIEAKGGIMGANDGRLQIGMSARLLKPEETSLGLSAVEIARVAGVLAVNAGSVKIKSIKSSQFCGIYSGNIKNWKELGGHDAQIKVFTKPEADSAKGVIRQKIACFSKLSEAPGVVVMPKAQDMNNALINNPNSIGYVDMVSIDDSKGKINSLILDGINPTEESVKNGKWPIIKHYMFVTKGEPKGLAKKFIDFVKSSDGSRIIAKNKAVPVK